MGSTKKSEVLAQLKERFPEAAEIKIFYVGSGDSFDSFQAMEVYDQDGNMLTQYQNDYEAQKEFEEIAADMMFWVMDHANNQPDFNNDGSEGFITFDLVDRIIVLENSYLEDVTQYEDEDGNEIEDYEIDYEERPTPPEVF